MASRNSSVGQALRLGLQMQQTGDVRAAESAFRRVLAADSENLDALQLLGVLCASDGRLPEGILLLQRAVAIRPDLPSLHSNLGLMLLDAGQVHEAVAAHSRAVELPLQPAERAFFSGARAHFNLGTALARANRPADAASSFAQAALLEPKWQEARSRQAANLIVAGEEKEAKVVLASMRGGAGDAATRLRAALVLPSVPESYEDIARARVELGNEIDSLLRQEVRIADPLRDVNLTAFYLAYHGLNNRTLHEQLARLYLHANPGLQWVAPHCRQPPGTSSDRLRVGFISRFLRRHSIGKTTRGFFDRLDRSRFETVALFVPPLVRDDYSDAIRAAASTSIALPPDFESAREMIASLRLDVLFYQDINMEPFTYFLAFARLAHVQCTSFGHPDTTGIPTMDWFVTSDLFEPTENAGHYTEQLFAVRGAPTLAYYYRPSPPPPLSRAELGLPDAERLYVCAQNLFKFHPDFDAILAGIVHTDPLGKIVLVGSRDEPRTRRLLARLESRLPGIADRIVVAPRRPEVEFLALLRAADVALDTPHFNGMNSSLEAFAMGTPVVTLPGGFQRGRHTRGMYEAMGIEDCIARDPEDYVGRAVAIASDRDRRQHLSERILARSETLFERDDVVREFERFFETAFAAAARSGGRLTC